MTDTNNKSLNTSINKDLNTSTTEKNTNKSFSNINETSVNKDISKDGDKHDTSFKNLNSDTQSQQNVNNEDKSTLNSEIKNEGNPHNTTPEFIVDEPKFDADAEEIQISEDERKQQEQEEIKIINSLTDAALKAAELKQEGNKFFKTKDYKAAETYYKEGLDVAEGYINTYKYDKNHELFKRLLEDRVALYSNLSNLYLKQENFTEVFNIDMYIITQLDPNWDKAYNRIILATLNKGDIDIANNYANLFKSRFSADTLDKFKSTFDSLEEANIKRDAEIKKNMNNTTNKDTTSYAKSDNMSENISETKSKGRGPLKAKKRSSFSLTVRYFLGGFLFLGGLFTFYFLFKNKYRRAVKN